MATDVLVLDAVTKSYGEGDARIEVLHGVDLRVRAGELAALIGPSGSGKSTLLNILGLLDRPTTGRVHLTGVDTTDLDDHERTLLRNRALGFVFQFHHLIPALTAEENVRMPLALASGRMSAALRPRAVELLQAVGLGNRADSIAGRMSGGQQQRVAIARALVANPALVLADEPTGNLDTQTADQVFALFRRFHQERGTAFLIVTHDPRLAARCDRVIELVDGRIVRDEETRRPRGEKGR